MPTSPQPKASRIQVQYRPPIALFYPLVTLFLLLTHLAWFSVISDDGQTLVPNSVTAEKIRHISALPPGEKRSFHVDIFFHYVLKGLFGFAQQLGLSIEGVRGICFAAWGVHVVETYMAWKLCVEGKASFFTKAAYLVMTGLGGFGQLLPLKKAMAEYNANKERHDK